MMTKSTKNRYLITGFSGFVARHFIEYLDSNGEVCIVKGLDLHHPDFAIEQYKNIQISFEKVDLLAINRVASIIQEFQPNYILHLASFSSVAFSWEEPVQSFKNNTNIFLNLADVVRKLNLLETRILSVGSSEEYGNINDDDDLPLKESHRLNPISPYAVARVAQEYLSKVYADGYGMDIVMTRSFNHIGPLQSSAFAVPSWAKQLVELKKFGKSHGTIVTGDVSIVRDFTDVRDIVRAYYLLLHNGSKGQVYNVCSGKGVRLRDIINIMAEELNIEVRIHTDPRLIRRADNRIIIGSNEKIKRELGWENRIPLEQSLRDVINCWKEN